MCAETAATVLYYPTTDGAPLRGNPEVMRPATLSRSDGLRPKSDPHDDCAVRGGVRRRDRRSTARYLPRAVRPSATGDDESLDHRHQRVRPLRARTPPLERHRAVAPGVHPRTPDQRAPISRLLR